LHISGKLQEFNSSIDASQKIDEAQLVKLEDMMKQVKPTTDHLNTLKALLQWPPSKNTQHL